MLEKIKAMEKKELAKICGIIALIALILLVIGRQIGYNMNLSDEVIRDAVALDAQCAEKQAVLDKLNSDLLTAQEQLDENTKSLEEIADFKAKKSDYAKQLSDAQSKIDELNGQVSSLGEQITAKQSELDLVTANVTKAAGAPITLPAGKFTVGTHLPAGRYKITGSSNLMASDHSINIILGSRYGVSEYVTDLSEGVVLDCRGSDTFTPLEK